MTVVGERIIREEEQKLVKKIKNYIYDPQQLIGSGFSSSVYKGINELNQETIAVKVLELSKIQTEVQKYLLNNEINALRALTHQHVLRTVQILMTKNNVYIMTEFCQNGDLQQYIKKQGKLSQLQALSIFRDIVDGYIAIQQKKIVHRDLKTANIFLSNTGARIADFGFCEFLNETKKPQMFYNVGSPAYMSPESYRQNIYTNKSDIWSMGIIFYEMLIGQTPDKNLTYSQMSNNLMAGRINSGSNEQIRHILSLCFKKDLKQRISPSNLFDLVGNEIARLKPRKSQTSNTITPINPFNNHNPNHNQYRNMVNHTISSQNSAKVIQTKHIVSQTQTFTPKENEKPTNIRSQSPFKTRFNGIMSRQQNRVIDQSPVKVIVKKGSNSIVKQESNFPFNINNAKEIQSNKIKSHTQMMVFIFRLFNYMNQVHLQVNHYVRLIIFRHRTFLQFSIEKIIQEDKLDKNTYQPLKQFYFMKNRFDQAYLQRQSQQNTSISINIANKLNQFVNNMFIESKCIFTYCSLTLDALQQYQKVFALQSDENQINKIGLAFDYLMIHYEIMQLYLQGVKIQTITEEMIKLNVLLKDQPKRLSPSHNLLMKFKFKMLSDHYEEWSKEFRDKVNEGNSYKDSPAFKNITQIHQRKNIMQLAFF